MEDKKSVVTDESNTFVSSECAVKKVTVYSDRAEVCRLVETVAKRGVNEIVLKQLPSCIDPDSIRVEGKGPATIAEVSFQRKFLPRDEAETSLKEKELTAQIETLTNQKKELDAKLDVITKQTEVLHNFGNTVSNVGASKGPAPALDSTFFSGIGHFVQLIGEQGDKLVGARLDIQQQITTVVDKMAAADQNLKEIRGPRSRVQESRECTIVLECENKAKILLTISYVVSRASWIPSYDIRMFTTEGTMKIFYYGQIKQSTGEDWMDAKLFLSTAMPSVGGVVPKLAIQQLSIKNRHVVRRKKSRGVSLRQYKTMDREYDDSMLACGLTAEVEPCGHLGMVPEPEITYATSEVNLRSTSATYEIARLSTIPSDNVDHKVSVGILDVKPKLEYITLPKTIPHAFLQARVTNTSQFTLLPGATSIFLDNSFVAKASVKAVSPGEEFECSLGVDPGVRITYKPLKKFRESSGIFSKTVCTTYEQVTELKNSHDYQIKIELHDQLPRSSDEKIKVNLLEPFIDVKHPEKNPQIRLTKHSHVVWEVNLEKQEKKEIHLKYSVEHPASEEISSSEVFES